LRYRTEHRWVRGDTHPPTFSTVFSLPEASEPISMHFHENTLAFYDKHTINLLDLSNRRERITIKRPDDELHSSLCVNRNRIVTTTIEGTVHIYDDTLNLLETIKDDEVSCSYIYLEDNLMTLATSYRVKVFDLNARTPCKLEQKTTYKISCVDVDGNLLAIGNSLSDTVEVWDIRQQSKISSLRTTGIPKGMKISGNFISIVESPNWIKVQDLRAVSSYLLFDGSFEKHFFHEGKLVTGAADSIEVRNGASARPLFSLSTPWNPMQHRISKIQCDWNKIVVGCSNGDICMWNFG